MILNNTKKFNSFLRWTGSKRWFVKSQIENFLPDSINNYHEPFLGGGAVFFFLKNNKNYSIDNFYLSDINSELINAYTQIRDNQEFVVEKLKNYNNLQELYYQVRSLEPVNNIERASRFIYLNRTSFNGIYRVNSKGKYNVPFGKRVNVDIATPELFKDVSLALKDTSISNIDFEDILSKVKKNDFLFIDPPYTVAHENNGFIEYNQNLFTWEDQIRLKDFISNIVKLGANFILTNAAHESIAKLYDGICNIHKVERHSQVGGRLKTRGKYNEFILTNIPKKKN